MLPLTPDAETTPTPGAADGFTTTLSDSSPRYVGTLRDGAVFVMAAMVINLGATVAMFVVGLTAGPALTSDPSGAGETMALLEMAHALVMLVSTAAGVLGWWWLTTRDPKEAEFASPSKSRPVVRFAVIAQTLLLLALAVGPASVVAMTSPDAPEQAFAGAMFLVAGLGLTAFVAMAVKFFATMSYVRWLAGRIPDETLDESAARFMWLGPVLVTIGALVVVGPLIAVIMYWNLIFKTWRGLSEIAMDQRDQAELLAAGRREAA